MCFFSKQTKDAQSLENRFKAKIENPEYFQKGDFNGFTHPICPIVSNDKVEIFQFAQWGLIPDWSKDKSLQNSTLNAKIETIHLKPSFKNYISKRCMIPADGFYEWQWLDLKGKQKQKYLLHLPDDDLFAFAGLWNEWHDYLTGESIQTYTILTTEANVLMSKIHNSKKRMPVIIHPKSEKEWLRGGNLEMFNDKLIAKRVEPLEQLNLWADND